ncbi:MAG: caspase family protein [Waddliaceae bacterium]|nr:caspase family protein [Waddliaceae bacterium]
MITIRIRSFFIRIIFSVSCLFAGSASAATLHAIIAADTSDYYIGSACLRDFVAINIHVHTIANVTGLDIEEHVFYGTDFKPFDIVDTLRDLECSDDDVIVFYFSGHGFNTEERPSIWPVLDFKFHGLAVDDVVDIINSKKARFSLIFNDCCNSIIPENYTPPYVGQVITKASPYRNYITLINNYRALFLETEGVIITSSSSPGERSRGYTNEGSWYTGSYLESFEEIVSSSETPTWEMVFEDSNAILQKKISSDNEISKDDYAQTPLVDIDLN